MRARRWARAAAMVAGAVAATVATASVAAITARDAHATPVDGVVAVVGERPILRSELQARAGRAPATRELLERIIDERLEEEAAARAHLVVSEEEIDARVARAARDIELSVRDLLAKTAQQGVTEQSYRDDLRRDLLRRKLVAIHVRPRVHVTEQDLHAAYARWRTERDTQRLVDLRILVLQIPAEASPARVAAIEARAARIVEQVKAGADFCAFIRRLNASSGRPCGSYGPVPTVMLQPELARAAQTIARGEVAAPVPFVDPVGGRSFLVVQKSPVDPPVPSFDEVRDTMVERALDTATEHARKQWLRELRRHAYVDVRIVDVPAPEDLRKP